MAGGGSRSCGDSGGGRDYAAVTGRGTTLRGLEGGSGCVDGIWTL